MMQALEQLARMLRRTEPTTALRALRADVDLALAHGQASDAEVEQLIERARDLKVDHKRSI